MSVCTVDEPQLNVEENTLHDVQEKSHNILDADPDDNLTVMDNKDEPNVTEEEPVVLEEAPTAPDVNMEEDGKHFNKNKDDLPHFGAVDDMQKVPQSTLENPLDMGLVAEVEHSSSGW